MALFGVGRRTTHGKEAVPGPGLVQPRRSLDGWTLEGTALEDRFEREELRELGTLLHGVGAEMRTAWTYERAADLLERAGERPQALAVVEAWFALPEEVRRASPAATRSLGRRRQRLRSRLGSAAGPAAAIPAQARIGAAMPAKPGKPPAVPGESGTASSAPAEGTSRTEQATRR
ncbi:hypothetical protein [Embleya sp. NPDC020886]|uniref:hypothetical protein n=1 Tax=Embleya sp. NPDC020886 TaxID=3363980 RepID=UPI0037A171A8